MTSASKKHEPLPRWLEVILYPFHFTIRLIVRAIVLLAAISGLALGAVLIFFILALLYDGWSWIENAWGRQQVLGTAFTTFALIASLGLLATVFTKAGDAIRRALVEIGEEILRLVIDWLPRLNTRESLAGAKKDIQEIGTVFKRLFSAPYRLILPLSIVVFLAFFAILFIDEDAKWKDSVEAALKNPKNPTVIVVVPPDHEDGEEAIPPPPLRLGMTFAIAHVEQGSLETSKGICLDDNISRPWLTTFKAALTQCGTSMPNCRPELVVRAFASVAPLGGGEDAPATPPNQEKLNCEIANRRAEEVVNFLRHPSEEGDSYECKSKVHDLADYGDNRKLCERDDVAFEFGKDDGLAFDLRYEPWQSHEAMVADRPADDGRLEGRRRHRVEFFNRSVQLTLTNYGCESEQCEVAAQSDPESTEEG